MKINPISSKIIDPTGISSEKKKSEVSSTTSIRSTPVNPETSVNISSTAQKVSSLSSSEAVFDLEKVAQIKAAISNGEFKVNAELVADGLISTVKDLIKTQSYKT